MQAQIAILGNSANYKLDQVRSIIDSLGEPLRDMGRQRRPQVTPEMLQAMGIPVEIEYKSA